MTREEAIIILKDCELNPCVLRDREAADMAIKALEQEPILDKIRDEIMKLQTYKMFRLDGNDKVLYIERADILSIIDKYKAESEDKE